MFDIGFGELLLIAVVALVVLGPERLPKAARTFGTLLRRLRNGWESVRAEVEKEIEAEELKQKLKEAQEYMHQAGKDVDDSLREGAESVRRVGESVMHGSSDADTSSSSASAGKVAKPAPDHAEEDTHER